jgi:hypothetical protein
MLRAGLAASGLALVLAASSGCSLILDFDSAGDDGGDDAVPYTQAECDFGEPNNTVAEAFVLTPTDVGPAAICPSTPEDRDHYRFTVPAGTANVSVRIMFTNRPTGDLDLRLTDMTGATTFGQSRGFEDVELITCPGSSPVCPSLPAGDYIFEVFPATPGSVNRYEIALTITPM